MFDLIIINQGFRRQIHNETVLLQRQDIHHSSRDTALESQRNLIPINYDICIKCFQKYCHPLATDLTFILFMICYIT